MRIAIAIAILPIAVIAKAGRIVFTAIISGVNKAWGEGIYHESAGWVVFVIAFVVLLFVHRAINAAYHLKVTSDSRRLRHV